MKKGESSAEKWIQKGRRVWVKSLSTYHNPFQDAFLQGQIVEIQNNKQCRVLLAQSKQEFQVPFDNCLKLTYGNRDVADMVDLQELNEPELLFNIKRRYVQDCIFTYCGPTLLIINPYTKIQRLFNDSVLQQYQSHVFSDTLEYKTLSPHIFALAAFCLWQLFDNSRNQSIVISGESGAGKTQNTKYCLKFLASLGKNMKQLINQSYSNKKSKMSHNLRAAERAVKKTSSKVFGIEEKILGCNQILQAFGNSKTIRNDNSSRFGKLILLVYGETQIQIKSAFIISYLLEKSRIVSVSQGERNYHIFYYLVKGTSPNEKASYMLKSDTSHYHYLNQSSVSSIPNMSDEEKFNEIKKEFQLYLDQKEIDTVLRILSVVLNLGNITFKKTQIANSGQTATVSNTEYLQIISQLLQVPQEDLSHCLQFKTRKMGLSVMNSPLRYEQAISLRDSFAKNIYQKTFNFLIKKMNEKIQIQQVTLQEEKSTFRKSIGLLDIFGFEVLNNNSLEQFFINFANQKLQQLYVSYIFKEEQNQFMRQGLRQFSHDIGFQDNKPIIDLFENYPLGIFHLINQSSELNQDDKDLPSSIEKNHSKNNFLKIPKTKKSAFQILHSCSPVSYNTSGFTIKNKDEFPQQLLEVIQKSKSNEILKICIGDEIKQKTENNQKSGKNAAKKFLGSKFLNSMNTLIQQLYSCDCHFVRCIKPNSKKSPKLFNSESVLQSLRYLGVLDSIIIRKLGYIYRRPFKEFYKKFYQLDNYIYSFHQDVNKLKTEDDFKKECQKVINKYLMKEFRQNDILLGHKKILIKQSTLNHLELLTKEKRKLRISVANRFKTMYKNAVFRTKVKVFLRSIKVLKVHMKLMAGDVKEKIFNTKVMKIQNVIKKFLWQKRLQKIKQQATKSVTKISAFFKMKRQRKIYLKTKDQIREIQSNVRLYLTMGKIIRERQCRRWIVGIFEKCWETIERKKVILIQKVWKGYLVRKRFREAIERMKRNIRLSKIKGKFKRALFVHKYNKFREALQRYRNPIIRLQAIVRGKFLHRVYTNVRKSTLIIQRAYRRHLKKKFYLSKEWQAYRSVIETNERGKQNDLLKMGIRQRPIMSGDFERRQLDETVGLLKRLMPSQMSHHYLPVSEQISLMSNNKQSMNLRINQTTQSGQKNTLQLYVLDYDSRLDYSTSSSILLAYQNLKNELKLKGEYLIYSQLTQTHMVIVSNKQKMYAISLSDHSAQEQSVPFTIRQLYCTDENVVVMPYEQQKLYQWKLQSTIYVDDSPMKSQANQYSLNNNKKSPHIHHIKSSPTQQMKASPIRLNQITNESIVPFDMKKQLLVCYVSKGQTELIANSSKIYQKSTLFGRSHIQIQSLPPKISVTEIAVSYHFMHLLTSAGTVFSKGKNIRGELGLGMVSNQVKSLELNNELVRQKEFIESISVGMSHTVAKSKLGYVYTWGDNSFGQLSLSSDQLLQSTSISNPTRVQYQGKPLKAIQIAAGFRTSYFLCDNLKILICGTSLVIGKLNTITEATLLQDTNYKAKYINPIKLKSIWNLYYSILTVNAIDFSKCKEGSKPDAILKYAKVLAKQWIYDTLYPPYHQFIDNCLNLSDLRKLKFKQKNQPKSQNDKKKTDKLSKLQELKMIIQLRKTSSLFKQAAKTKIDQFLYNLDQKHKDKWTAQQKELYEIIMNDNKKHSQ